mmetsp:Transcript_43468/g.81059  ORF Transcript_43468/g.81059 Transcript_43468/m.81059 type:complete len:531 (-) Transcript_43468:36-1628(-)
MATLTQTEVANSTLKLDASATLRENFQQHQGLDATTKSKVQVQPQPQEGNESVDTALRRCRELIRTVPIEDFVEAPESLWLPPQEDTEGGDQAEGHKALQAESDPEGGGLFLSHAWDEPERWEEHFAGQSFVSAKQMQVATALREAERRQLHREGLAARVWADCSSLPSPVSQSDHPLEQTIFGPYRLPVAELKSFVPRVPDGNLSLGYTLMHLPEGHSFTGSMRKTEWDDHGRPLRDPQLEEVSWTITAGWHFIRNCRVIPEGFIAPWTAAEKPEYRPLKEQLRRWCARLALRDEVWLEFTLGSLRAECLLLADTMLTMHSGFVAVVGWNYFDRLWPLWEWAVFCARCGTGRVQLATDAFTRRSVVEYHRAIRRLSVERALCRDERDRPILLDALESLFQCSSRMEMVEVRKLGGENGGVIKERMVDFSPVERFVRATAIAAFAREAALASSRELEKADESGWISLAEEFGLHDLHRALKMCKPWDWQDLVQQQGAGDPDLAYESMVEAWWEEQVLPEVERERCLALGG